MSDPIIKKFLFGDGLVHDASVSEISAALQICFRQLWSLQPAVIGLNGSPTYSIEVSNDNITFNPYDVTTEDAAITQGFDDTHFNFLWVRIDYKEVDNTTGTVKFEMILK